MKTIQEWKKENTRQAYDLWAMKQAIKRKDLQRQAQRNEKQANRYTIETEA